jgi:predicted RNase H-like nuclease (RuvC/YqgF family)
LTKLRDAKQAEIIQTRQLEAEENNQVVQLQETLSSLRSQISLLEREKYSFRDQTALLQKRTNTTLNRQKSVSEVTSLITDTISQSLAEPSSIRSPAAATQGVRNANSPTSAAEN